MPELPEVETIKRGLDNKIVGKKIADIEVSSYKIFRGRRKDVVGKRVIGLDRRAKVLRVCLENKINLLFHLKMTGQLIYRSQLAVGSKIESEKLQTANRKPQAGIEPQTADSFAGGHPTQDWVAELPNKFTKITFTFDDDSKLFYNDIRMFGWCKVLSDKQVEGIFNAEYGPEPLDSRSGKASKDFTVEYLKSMAKRFPNRKVKQFILDQKIIAGVGNIYSDEALFYAKISPLRPVKEISDAEWKKLRNAIIKSLELGIKWGGASIDTYVNADGEIGGAHLHTKVYRHTGAQCPDNCGGEVKKIIVGGRGTHYCPSCQR